MSPRPPAWINWLIDNLAPLNFAEEIRGDLHEMYQNDITARGPLRAKIRYVVNALGFLCRRFFWSRDSESKVPNMIKNHFTIATRSLLAHKGTTIINVLGLVVGIASALTIFTVIKFELSFDKFHSHADRTYRLVRISGPDSSEFRTGIPYPVPVAI